MLDFTNVYKKNFKAWKDDSKFYVINQGGTSASKTFSILQLLVAIGIKYNYQIDIVGLSVPHLKTGVLTDMRSICDSFGLEFYENFKESDKILKLPSGYINFLAFDKLGKAHGGRRDILYINEANHIAYPIAEQLMIRTRKKVFIDYNPTNAFWAHKELIEKEPQKCEFIKSTYKDNQFLSQNIINSIEARRGDGNNNFWRVYGLGELGIAEGLVFNNFEQKNFDKNTFENYRNGVDWGFSKDPFAFIRCAIEGKNLYICDEIYRRELLNKDSAPMVKALVGNEIVRCDSAEPKSVREFQQMGINAISVKKGAGSIESGIKFLQSFEHIYIHPDCPNTYDEFCNYQWRTDKTGEQLPEPIDAFNHCLVAGTMILTDKGEKPIEEITTSDMVLTRKGYKQVLWAGVSDYNRKVYKVITDKGNFIIGTNNHKVLTTTGFCDIDKLSYGTKLLIKGRKWQKQFFYTVKNGQDTQIQKEEAIGNTLKADAHIYTTMFGKNLKGKEKKDLLFIIKMAILKIMIFQTLKKFLQKNTLKNILLVKKEEKKQGKTLKKETLSKSGIQAKKGKSGIENTQKNKDLESLTCLKLNANFVVKFLNLIRATINFVRVNASLHTGENRDLTTLLSVASGVEKNLLQTNIQKQDFVVGRVLIVQELKKQDKVYDITVDECHEFFANGILVHNCLDATRYSLEADMSYKQAKFVDLWD